MTSKILTYPFPSAKSDATAIQHFLSEKRKRVLVGGCYDLLHYGHLSFFKEAKKLGETLIVALEPDTSIERIKGAPPIHSQVQRAEILAELTCIDYVLLLPSLKTYEEYLTLVQKISPNFLAVTAGDPQLASKQKQANTIGAQVIEVIQLIEGLSSSLIRNYHLY